MNLLNKRFELSAPLAAMLSGEEQERSVQESMKQSKKFLNLLLLKLENDLESKVKESEGVINYENSNWAYKQAELLGYRKALRHVVQLINPIEVYND